MTVRVTSWIPRVLRLAFRAVLRRDGAGLRAIVAAHRDRELGPARLRAATVANGGSLTLLVVCHGNIYRSAFAHGLLVRELRARGIHDVHLESAGTLASPPRPTPDDGVAMAGVFGISLADHRSRTISEESVASADVIIAMDYANAVDILRRFPGARAKLAFAGAFLREEVRRELSIPDPNGRGAGVLTESFSLVALAAQSIVSELEQRHAVRRSIRPRSVAHNGVMRLLSSSVANRAWLRLSRAQASILMLHRFQDSSIGIKGHSAAMLALHLAYLRRHRFNLSSLRDLVERLQRGLPPLPRTVVFTVDDGYVDFAHVAAPIFAHFGCPVTVFLVTGFVDGSCWMWPDRVRTLAGSAASCATHVSIGGHQHVLEWTNALERDIAIERLIAMLSRVADSVRVDCLKEWEERSDAPLPVRPPARYSAMGWADVRRLAARGVDFGAHTHRHPLLSRIDPALARSEIIESWTRLKAELPGAVPVFCYPNGLPGDFTEENRRTVEQIGMQAAVAAHGGTCSLRDFRADRFALSRFAYEESPSRFHQLVGGFEAAKSVMRRPWTPPETR